MLIISSEDSIARQSGLTAQRISLIHQNRKKHPPKTNKIDPNSLINKIDIWALFYSISMKNY